MWKILFSLEKPGTIQRLFIVGKTEETKIRSLFLCTLANTLSILILSKEKKK